MIIFHSLYYCSCDVISCIYYSTKNLFHEVKDALTDHPAALLQVVDLGEPAYSMASRGGCHPQEHACHGGPGMCGYHGECVGGINQPHCECHSGWSGSSCSTPTVPATLGKNSYLKMALSFTPPPRELNVQLRLRTRGSRSGFLVRLAAHHRSAAFTLHVGLF